MKTLEKTAILIAETKKTLYLQRGYNRSESEKHFNSRKLCHPLVSWHSEAVRIPLASKEASSICRHLQSRSFLALLITSCLCLLQQRAESHNSTNGYESLIPQAPDAQALARAIDVPVNAYTGIPQISIPLYEINVGELSIPIMLSYHAGGILASQEATEVGLGWSLSAGGSITRTIKCIDDFNASMGYFSYLNDWDENFSTLSNYFNIWSWSFVKDMEPDIFYYSTPTESGKFYFDHERNAHFVNIANNSRLEAPVLSNSMELTDSRGNTYIYEDIEETQPYTMNGSPCLVNTTFGGYDAKLDGYLLPGYQASERFNSAWKLSRIITPTGDTVTFIYEELKYQLPVQETAVKRSYLESIGIIEYGLSPAAANVRLGMTYTSQKCWVNSKRLTEIRWRGGKLIFEGEDREDILPLISTATKPKAIKTIRVTDATGNTIRKWLFDYSYFNNGSSGEYAHLFKRLKLESVKEILSADSIGYSFCYDEAHPLPAKNTKNTDHWGYFNGTQQGEDYVCPAILNGTLYAGGDKEPRLGYTRLGTLESMTHPTGGSTVFTYENNTTSSPSYTELTQARYSVTASRSSDQIYAGVSTP